MRAKGSKPAGPSPRVYVAFGVAAVVGLGVFLIWWFTSPGSVAPGAPPGPPPAAAQADLPANDALVETTLPRGGTLTGSAAFPELAAAWLTGAPLVRIHRGTDALEPWLAESWSASADNLVYTLKLRPGLVRADDSPLTAAEVVAALGPIQVPSFPADKHEPLDVRAIDAATLEVRFRAPFAPALRLLDSHLIAGTGPFVEEKPGRFVRNPRYWRKAADGSPLPHLDAIFLAQGAPAELDFADAEVRVDDYEGMRALEQSGKGRLFDLGPGLDADALWFAPADGAGAKTGRPDRPWLASETFRLAVSTAVSRRDYCKQVFFGACDPIALPVSPANSAWFNPDLPLGQANPQLARTMLVELGLRDRSGDGMLNDATRRPVRFSLLIRRDVPSSARAAQYLAGTLKEIGVQVDITPVTAEVLRARRAKGDYDAIYDRIEMRDTDPAMNLDFWLSSGPAHPWHGARSTPPADWERQIDQLMATHASTFDRVVRLQSFVDVQKIYHQHMPAIFFGVPHVRIFTSVGALNATPSILRPHLLWNAEGLARIARP